MRSVLIDFDIHKMMEMERASFEESDTTVLRRLLKLPPPTQTPSATRQLEKNAGGGKPWRGDGIELPHGTDIFMTYAHGAQQIFGKIQDGFWVVNGQRYKTPSGAASGAAIKPDGTNPILGGYKYWHIFLPGAKEWVSLQSFRAGKPIVSQGIQKPLMNQS